jgi:hypothetical protein
MASTPKRKKKTGKKKKRQEDVVGFLHSVSPLKKVPNPQKVQVSMLYSTH